jgi:DNA-directed RNA polymerase subunit beta'
VERLKPEVWDVLEEVIKHHPVLLNRAPTLHRLGIQAFEPVLVEGRAIKLHPLVCTAYNADFDGDQMAVHVPLSMEAQAEARLLMLAANNILKPQDGAPVVSPTQDMVLGTYYLTIEVPGEKGEGKAFADYNEMLMAYQEGIVKLHAKVKVKVTKEIDGELKHKLVESTVGRFIFNEIIPQDLGMVDRSDPAKAFDLEVDGLVDKKVISEIVGRSYRKYGSADTSVLLDKIKEIGFKYATLGGITIGVTDMVVPEEKKELLSETDQEIDRIQKVYRRGLISNDERYEKVINAWTKTTEAVTNSLMENLDILNPINMMALSGARGSKNQIRQLAGMRGLMANPSGKIIELPIRSNFREGLDVLEFFISTHGARKGLADTALRTADSGYLTRRLVDVSQDVIIREEDCGTTQGYRVTALKNGSEIVEGLMDRINGRYAFEDVLHPQTGEIIVAKNQLITYEKAELIEKLDIKSVMIRTVLNCQSKIGVCGKCYGINLATGGEVNIGEAVGIIAAQSIGEPGTQLTMRTFHTGGVAGDDITHGLPRVEELFEARKPKGLAIISEIAGKVESRETKKKKEIIIVGEDGETKSYTIPYGSRLKVQGGDLIEAGDEITEGSVNPHDILNIKGVQGVQQYLLKEVQMVYRLQGVDINDKHIEVIVRQMLRKVKVDKPGDTDLLPGGLVDIFQFEEENNRVKEMGGQPATGQRVLLGITKASLATDSFLSAASFQETTRVLTEAAIKGKVDNLVGLKENVIIGKLVPSGTGMDRYRSIKLAGEKERAPEETKDAIEEYYEIGENTMDGIIIDTNQDSQS